MAASVSAAELGTRVIKGDVPANCREGVPVCLGIDEAGRGPVLGAMTYGAAYWPVDQNDEIAALGFDDSKALSAERRAQLFEALKKSGKIGWIVESIHPAEISAKMLRRTPYSLNAISHDSAVRLVRTALADGVNVTEVFVDTVGTASRYEEYLTKTFANRIKFTVAKKADSIYPVVSAASICAKVTRDVELEAWEYREPGFVPVGEMGSGYPGDETTKTWLRQNSNPVFGFPSIVRFSWSTTTTLQENTGVKVEWEPEDSDKPRITGFFSGEGEPAHETRCDYFKSAGLSRAMDF